MSICRHSAGREWQPSSPERDQRRIVIEEIDGAVGDHRRDVEGSADVGGREDLARLGRNAHELASGADGEQAAASPGSAEVNESLQASRPSLAENAITSPDVLGMTTKPPATAGLGLDTIDAWPPVPW